MLKLFAAWLIATAALLGGLAGGTGAQAQDLQPIPALTSRVIDTTGTLGADQRAAIEATLAALEKRKGSQVAVLMVPTTGPEPIEAYALRVAEAWKLGRAQAAGQAVDDGVLLLVAKNDRKLRIEVGRGLEGAIPDALAKRIIAETIAPRFRQGDFAGGVAAGVAEIARLIEGESLPAPWQGAHDEPDGLDQWLFMLAVAVAIGLFVSKLVGRFLGAVGAGAGTGVWSLTQGLPLTSGALLGIGAFLAVLFMSTLSRGGGGRGGRGGGRHDSGPIWGGGGLGGGGGSSDSGFSGGGGGFSGGGASGDW